jgi:ABC-type dipeptide/oligopeptide/nickel transport system permease subunit
MIGRRWRQLGWAGQLGLAVLIGIAIAGLLGPFVWSSDPERIDLLGRYAAPSLAHPLGTDQFGRDLLSRLLAGARLSLGGATVVLGGCSALGFLVGATAGVVGGWCQALISRIIDVLLALPALIVAIGVVGILGPSFGNLLLALVLTGWPWYARVYRALVAREVAQDYVRAAESLGASRMHIVARHVLRNVAGPALVLSSVNFGGAILALASLSFLGLGARPTTPEWGAMVGDGRFFFQSHPWVIAAPGLAIAVTVFAVNLLGDAVRDLSDPRFRQR